jgi:hypothetical protein
VRSLRRATRGPRDFVVVGGLGALVSGAACLGTLPAPALCPAPAESPYCSLTLVVPEGGDRDDGGLACSCAEDPQRDCSCNVDHCAARSSSACYPPPDCPPAVRQATPGALCLDSKPQLTSSIGPNIDCSCGCATCAFACDGEGFVLGGPQDADLYLELSGALPPSGSLSVLVRARGSGAFTISALSGSAVRPAPVTVTGTDFQDWTLNTGYTWTTAGSSPDQLDLTVTGQPSIEIDCIVPYVAP